MVDVQLKQDREKPYIVGKHHYAKFIATAEEYDQPWEVIAMYRVTTDEDGVIENCWTELQARSLIDAFDKHYEYNAEKGQSPEGGSDE